MLFSPATSDHITHERNEDRKKEEYASNFTRLNSLSVHSILYLGLER